MKASSESVYGLELRDARSPLTIDRGDGLEIQEDFDIGGDTLNYRIETSVIDPLKFPASDFLASQIFAQAGIFNRFANGLTLLIVLQIPTVHLFSCAE